MAEVIWTKEALRQLDLICAYIGSSIQRLQ
jgi:hypothetical protein